MAIASLQDATVFPRFPPTQPVLFAAWNQPPASHTPQELPRQTRAPHISPGRRRHPRGHRARKRLQLPPPPGPPCRGGAGAAPRWPRRPPPRRDPYRLLAAPPSPASAPGRVQRLPQLPGPPAASPASSAERGGRWGGGAGRDGTGRAVRRGRWAAARLSGAETAGGGGVSRARRDQQPGGLRRWESPCVTELRWATLGLGGSDARHFGRGLSPGPSSVGPGWAQKGPVRSCLPGWWWRAEEGRWEGSDVWGQAPWLPLARVPLTDPSPWVALVGFVSSREAQSGSAEGRSRPRARGAPSAPGGGRALPGPLSAVGTRDRGGAGLRWTRLWVPPEADCASHQVHFSEPRVGGFPAGFQPYFNRLINGDKKKKISEVFKSALKVNGFDWRIWRRFGVKS